MTDKILTLIALIVVGFAAYTWYGYSKSLDNYAREYNKVYNQINKTEIITPQPAVILQIKELNATSSPPQVSTGISTSTTPKVTPNPLYKPLTCYHLGVDTICE